MPEALKKIAGTTVAFGDVVQLSKERSKDPEADGFERFLGLEHLEPSDLKIRSWGDIVDGTTFTNVFNPGQVLFGKRRAYQRKVAVADFSGVCSGDIYVLEPKGNHLLPELLPFICQSEPFYDYVISMSQGGLSPRVNWKALAKYEFALPLLEEQRRTAAALRAATRAQELYLNSLANIKQVSEALCAETASSLAEQYPSVQLEEVADVRYGLTVNQARRKADTHAPYLRVANVLRGGLDLSEVKEIGVLPGDEGFELLSGDVLIVEGHANSAEIGRACVWLEPVSGMMHQNHLIRARCGETLSHEYLCMLINSPHGMVHFQSRAKSSSGLNTINSTVVKEYRIPLPPRSVQDCVMARLSGLSKAQASISTRHEQIKGMLDQLLGSITEELR